MYLVGGLEKCRFGSAHRFDTPAQLDVHCPSQSDPPTAHWTHQDEDKETSQRSQDSQTSVARTVFEGQRGVWRWARGVCGADATTARSLDRFGLKMCSAVLCVPQDSGKAAVRPLIPMTDEIQRNIIFECLDRKAKTVKGILESILNLRYFINQQPLRPSRHHKPQRLRMSPLSARRSAYQ